MENLKIFLFDGLSAEQLETIFLRTRCTLDQIKKAYVKCFASAVDKASVLKFALDPLGEESFKPESWKLCKIEESLFLIEIGSKKRMQEVNDIPTMDLLQSVFGAPEVPELQFNRRGPQIFSDDDVLTATEIERLGIPRATLQSWERTGLPFAHLPKLETDTTVENGTEQTSCRYGDLKAFLPFYRPKRRDKKGRKPSVS